MEPSSMKSPLSRLLPPLLALALLAPLPSTARADAPAVSSTDIRAKETFAVIWERLRNSGFKGEHEGLDWDALKAAHQSDIENAPDIATLRREIGELLEALKASHLELIPANALPKAGELPTSGTGDLGLRLAVIDRDLVVERVIPGSPAARAGIRPGWSVAKIGGFDARKAFAEGGSDLLKPRGLTMLQLISNQMVAAVAPGAPVVLGLRDAAGVERSVPLVAENNPNTRTITLPGLPPMPLRFEQRAVPLRGGGCALHVEFSQWAMPVFEQLVAALREYDECRGVILDLRGNSGGLIASMTALGGLFLDEPAAIGTMITGGGELKLTALPRVVDDAGVDIRRHGGPLAILTDRGSVSCSDMFAGGLQALGRARVFGDTSAGMALPSASVPLPSGDRLLYPTADYIDPKGRRIEGVGVIPDTPSPPTLKALRDGRDPALDAALAWIAKQR
jgi:carboxyl-terminal processing protease